MLSFFYLRIRIITSNDNSAFFEITGVRTGFRFFGIQEDLEEILGRKVDLNTAGFLSKYFRDKVLNEAQTIYERT
jgi:predicted nucleotidyltransferase